MRIVLILALFVNLSGTVGAGQFTAPPSDARCTALFERQCLAEEAVVEELNAGVRGQPHRLSAGKLLRSAVRGAAKQKAESAKRRLEKMVENREDPEVRQEFFNSEIDILPLTKKLLKDIAAALQNAGRSPTIGTCLAFSHEEFLTISGLGPEKLNDLVETLALFRFHLARSVGIPLSQKEPLPHEPLSFQVFRSRAADSAPFRNHPGQKHTKHGLYYFAGGWLRIGFRQTMDEDPVYEAEFHLNRLDGFWIWNGTEISFFSGPFRQKLGEPIPASQLFADFKETELVISMPEAALSQWRARGIPLAAAGTMFDGSWRIAGIPKNDSKKSAEIPAKPLIYLDTEKYQFNSMFMELSELFPGHWPIRLHTLHKPSDNPKLEIIDNSILIGAFDAWHKKFPKTRASLIFWRVFSHTVWWFSPVLDQLLASIVHHLDAAEGKLVIISEDQSFLTILVKKLNALGLRTAASWSSPLSAESTRELWAALKPYQVRDSLAFLAIRTVEASYPRKKPRTHFRGEGGA